jgi:hypothetical protein
MAGLALRDSCRSSWRSVPQRMTQQQDETLCKRLEDTTLVPHGRHKPVQEETAGCNSARLAPALRGQQVWMRTST